jgi:hypothetical protein
MPRLPPDFRGLPPTTRGQIFRLAVNNKKSSSNGNQVGRGLCYRPHRMNSGTRGKNAGRPGDPVIVAPHEGRRQSRSRCARFGTWYYITARVVKGSKHAERVCAGRATRRPTERHAKQANSRNAHINSADAARLYVAGNARRLCAHGNGILPSRLLDPRHDPKARQMTHGQAVRSYLDLAMQAIEVVYGSQNRRLT